ncbi:MAG: nucleotidyltransferase family protein [Chloroflexi bacterium]|nr:nucleotidyltransferase family protein [Chloroflexota bacterium]
MSEPVAIDLPLEAICAYCETQPIRRLSVFGSAARNELTPESDVDFLVEYLPEARVSLFDIGGHLMDFQDIIGRKVDLVTPTGLCPYIRDEVLDDARLIYAKESCAGPSTSAAHA